MKFSSFLIYTVCQIFLHWSKIFPDFFISSVWSFQGIPHLLPKAAEQNSAGKQKSKREFFRRENTRCTFSSRRHLCFRLGRPAAQSPTLPGRQHIPSGASRPTSSISVHQPQRPTRQSPNAFCSFGFPDAKTRGAYFFSIQNHCFRLDRPISANPLFISAIQSPTRQFIPFRRQPADSLLSYFFAEPHASRPPAHSLPAPAGQHLPPPFFPYRPHNPQPANSLPPGSAGRRLTSLPSTFLTFTKHHLPTRYRFPQFFQNPLIAIFPNILPVFAFPYLQLQSHPATLPTSSTSSVLLPLLQPAGQTRNVVSRAGAACKAADGAGEEPAFLFSSLFSLLSHLPGAAASPRRLHFSFYFFFLFLFFSFFLLLFLFLVFLFVFSLYFYSDFLFLFFLCFFFLLFLSFYFCSYLCFFVFYFYFFSFTFIFAFFIFSLCFSS